MTDAELIARLRAYREHDEGSGGMASFEVDECIEAADRIEALTKERDEAVHLSRMRKTFIEEARDERDAAEAKLAKAVGALRFYAWENEIRLPSDGPWGVGSTDFGKAARATLVEIKGESHD